MLSLFPVGFIPSLLVHLAVHSFHRGRGILPHYLVNGTDSVEIDTTLDWTNRDKYVELSCNAWDNGHSLYTAWDSVELF
jgi:hypothetical protein